MRILLALLVSGFVIGCGNSGSDSPKTPNPEAPPSKLTDEQKQEFLEILKSEGRIVSAQGAIENPKPNAEISADQPGAVDPNVEKMRQLLVEGGCKAVQEQRRVGKRMEVSYRVEGATCPISQTVVGSASQVGKNAIEGSGRLVYVVKDTEYRQLNDIVGADLRISGRLAMNEDNKSQTVAANVNMAGEFKSDIKGTLSTRAGLNLNVVTLKDKDQGAMRLTLWQRVRIQSYLGEIRVNINKGMANKSVQIEVWLNGERQSFVEPPAGVLAVAEGLSQEPWNQSDLLTYQHEIISGISEALWAKK